VALSCSEEEVYGRDVVALEITCSDKNGEKALWIKK